MSRRGRRARAGANRAPPSGRRRRPSSWCPPDGRWWWRCRRPAAPVLRRSGTARRASIPAGLYFASAGCADDAARDAQRIGRHLAVFVGAQVVGRDGRRVLRSALLLMRTVPRLVGFRLHTLAVKAGKLCSGSPKASSDSGCTWYSRFGHSCVGRAAREGAELRGRHAHRAAALQQVFEADLRLAEQRGGQHVERRRAVDLVDRADLQVVLQVGADARQVGHHLDAVLLQQVGRADARQLQDLRRADAAARTAAPRAWRAP